MPLYNPAVVTNVLKQTEIDFGTTPVHSKQFTIVDTDVISTTIIYVAQAGDAATGKSQDENDMDIIIFRAVPGSGQFTVYAQSLTGPVVGAYKINYAIG